MSSFSRYLRLPLQKIASKEPIDEKTFWERWNLYKQLLNSGMSPQAACNVIDFYMPDDPVSTPESVYFQFPDEL